MYLVIGSFVTVAEIVTNFVLGVQMSLPAGEVTAAEELPPVAAVTALLPVVTLAAVCSLPLEAGNTAPEDSDGAALTEAAALEESDGEMLTEAAAL